MTLIEAHAEIARSESVMMAAVDFGCRHGRTTWRRERSGFRC
jgi:hypothetical protein